MTVADAGAGTSRLARILGRVDVHPVLLAAWPALSLWAANVHEATPGEVWPLVWMPALAAIGAWAVGATILRSLRRGAVLASAAALVLLNAGQPTGGEPGVVTLVVATLLVAVAALAVVHIPVRGLLPTAAVANILAVVLVAATLPPLVVTWGPTAGPVVPADDLANGGLAGRDIWYIIPDRYPRGDTFEELFDFDNSPFLDGLEARGFQVQSRALANYPKTAHSLAAAWNLELVQDLVPDPPADGGDWQPLYTLLRDHRLGRILTTAGYEYLHLGTWWSPTSTAASADQVLRVDTHTEFRVVWESLTVLPALSRLVGDDPEPLTSRQANRRYSDYQLDTMDRLARVDGDRPRFILAHITIPHEPYVFDADGSYLTAEQAAARTREQNILNQVRYLNTRLEALFDELLAGPEDTWPVIVLKSDEGPHPARRTGPGFDWTTAPDEVLAEKLRTISAILLPGSELVIPEDLTGVNTWRLVLDATIGTNFGLIDDPVYVFPGESRLYDLVDVTDRLR